MIALHFGQVVDLWPMSCLNGDLGIKVWNSCLRLWCVIHGLEWGFGVSDVAENGGLRCRLSC